jgi:methionine synthase II (cobalamin-independent)
VTAPKTTVIGSYPVIASEAEVEHYLRRRSNEPGAGLIFSPFLKTAERAFRDQVSSGIEVPSTGQTPYDFVNLFLDPSYVEGVSEYGGGRRVTGNLRRKEPIRLDEVRYINDLIDSVEINGHKKKLLELKEPITDPYTLATGVSNDTSKDTRELTFEILKEIVLPEAKSIGQYVDYYQFDAPRYSSVSARPDYLKEIYQLLKSELDKPIVLHVCGDTSRIFQELTKFPVDVLSLDFTLTPKLIEETSKKNFDQGIGLGVTKTEPRVESAKEIANLIESATKKIGEGRIHFVHPACGQRNIPLTAAYAKNVNMTLARDEVFYGEDKLQSEVVVRAEPLKPAGYDPRGKFKIFVDNGAGEIVVSLVDYDNVPKRRLKGNYSEKILNRIIEEGILSEDSRGRRHLGYVALELAKAETALHSRLAYKQDQPLFIEQR